MSCWGMPKHLASSAKRLDPSEYLRMTKYEKVRCSTYSAYSLHEKDDFLVTLSRGQVWKMDPAATNP